MGGNEIRCWSGCHGDSMVLVPQQRDDVDFPANSGACMQTGGSSPSKSRSENCAHGALSGLDVHALPVRSPEVERQRMRTQLREFIADALETVPVSVVDIASGTMQV